MRSKNIFLLILILAFFVCGCSPFTSIEIPEDDNILIKDDISQNHNTPDDSSNPNTPDDTSNHNTSENDISNHNRPLRGAWITTVWNLDFPTNATKSDIKLKQEIDEIILKAKIYELNALFFQVRPCADAFYKSNIFPWSRFLSGTQGLAPNNNFDPLYYIIEQCHNADIELHAWINPFRVTALSSEKLTAEHPAILHPELTFKVNDKIFFNPGEPAARELVIDGVREILQNYDVDGIHYDDYFYPENINKEDYQTWEKHGSSYSIADFRRYSIDELIRQTYTMVKELKPSAVFGVSPSGIWANKSSNPLGSDTRGFESYSAIYADSRGWVKKNYIDYIAPQIYWHVGQVGSDFLTVLNWWQNVCEDTNVALLTGIAGYKAGTGGAWDTSSEFKNQINLANERGSGFIIFAFSDISLLEFS